MLAGRPKLVVAVTGYPNPFPKALDVAPKIVELCAPLIDTIITCTVRWVQLPPALELLDQAIKKLNTTIQNAVKPFTLAQPTAGRFFYVDIYTKTRDHCMKMDVKMKTKVEHPELEGTVHDHDNTTEVSFGCSDPWYVEGEDGTKNPFYLFPSIPPTVLLQQSQTTSGHGRASERQGPQVHLGFDLGARHAGTGRDAAQVEAEYSGAGEFEYLSGKLSSRSADAHLARPLLPPRLKKNLT